MKFIEEVVVEEFLPTFRSMLAEELSDRGLTQHEVANALGISQSAVSKYAHGEVTRHQAVAADERVQDLVERIGEGLSTGDMSRIQALVETEVLIRRLEARGDVIAGLHEDEMPALAEYEGDFRVHDPDSEVRARERVRSSLRRALRAVENTSGFAGLIPNVGTNVVECLPGADDIDDVAGVPGRIFDVKGQASVPGDPEFGVSAHVASVLLAAREAGSDARAALNIRYDPDLLATFERAGHRTAEFDADYDDLSAAVGAAITETPDATVLYQTGTFGIEPIVYVLAADAETAVADARDVL